VVSFATIVDLPPAITTLSSTGGTVCAPPMATLLKTCFQRFAEEVLREAVASVVNAHLELESTGFTELRLALLTLVVMPRRRASVEFVAEAEKRSPVALKGWMILPVTVRLAVASKVPR